MQRSRLCHWARNPENRAILSSEREHYGTPRRSRAPAAGARARPWLCTVLPRIHRGRLAAGGVRGLPDLAAIRRRDPRLRRTAAATTTRFLLRDDPTADHARHHRHRRDHWIRDQPRQHNGAVDSPHTSRDRQLGSVRGVAVFRLPRLPAGCLDAEQRLLQSRQPAHLDSHASAVLELPRLGRRLRRLCLFEPADRRQACRRQIIIMKIARAACCIALLLASSLDRMGAQSPGDVQVSGGVSTASFTTPLGRLQVHVSADAAPGDTISGVVAAEPAGATPQEQQANLGSLTGFVVELEGQQTKVASRQYEWTVPMALRTGRAMLTLRSADGRVVSRTAVPIDPQPPAVVPGPASAGIIFPADIQVGRPATIRGRSDGRLRGKTVDVGGAAADLLATSPRQIVFRFSQQTFGEIPIRLTDNGSMTEGRTRVMGARLVATNTQLVRGQRATLTTTVSGLTGINE